MRVIDIVEKGLHLVVILRRLLLLHDEMRMRVCDYGIRVVFVAIAVGLLAHGVDHVVHLLEVQVVDVVVPDPVVAAVGVGGDLRGQGGGRGEGGCVVVGVGVGVPGRGHPELELGDVVIGCGGELLLLMILLVLLLFVIGELLEDSLELFFSDLDLVGEVSDLDHAAPDGVLIAHGGVELDGLHGDGLLVVVGAEVFEEVLDVLDSEEAVHVLEHLGLIGREEGGQKAFRGATPPLVLASSAGLAGATLYGHPLILIRSNSAASISLVVVAYAYAFGFGGNADLHLVEKTE